MVLPSGVSLRLGEVYSLSFWRTAETVVDGAQRLPGGGATGWAKPSASLSVFRLDIYWCRCTRTLKWWFVNNLLPLRGLVGVIMGAVSGGTPKATRRLILWCLGALPPSVPLQSEQFGFAS